MSSSKNKASDHVAASLWRKRRVAFHNRITGMPIYRSRHVRSLLSYALIVFSDIRDYITRRQKISFLDMMKMWPKGFSANKLSLYDFDRYPKRSYISDVSVLRDFNYIYNCDKTNAALLDNKLLSNLLLRAHVPVPKLIAIIMDGSIIPLCKEGSCRDYRDILNVIKDYPRLVIIPYDSGASIGLHYIRCHNDGMVEVNQGMMDHAQLQRFVASLDGFMVLEQVSQAGYSERIYPNSTNTIRIMTLYDREKDEAVVLAAAHKFATNSSYPAETVIRGGLLSRIDLESGQLRETITRPNMYSYLRCEKHPDTGMPIEGTVIPNWDSILKTIRSASKQLAFLPYIGWDIVVTENNFVVIEGNTKPGIESMQILAPLLEKERNREIMRRISDRM